MIKIRLILGSIVSVLASTGICESIETTVKLNNSKDKIFVSLENSNTSDYLCKKLTVSLEFCNSNYCQQGGYHQITEQNIYLRNKTKVEFAFKDLIKKLSENEKLLINEIKTDLQECAPAQYYEYCQYADKSSAELFTLKTLQNHLNSKDCQYEVSKVTELNLDKKQIENLKPISFLTNLEKLSLQENQITSVAELGTLTVLHSVDLDLNKKLMDLNPILKLPAIEKIWAREIGVTTVDKSNASPTLQGVYTEGHAKICEIRFSDPQGQERIVYCNK